MMDCQFTLIEPWLVGVETVFKRVTFHSFIKLEWIYSTFCFPQNHYPSLWLSALAFSPFLLPDIVCLEEANLPLLRIHIHWDSHVVSCPPWQMGILQIRRPNSGRIYDCPHYKSTFTNSSFTRSWLFLSTYSSSCRIWKTYNSGVHFFLLDLLPFEATGGHLEWPNSVR